MKRPWHRPLPVFPVPGNYEVRMRAKAPRQAVRVLKAGDGRWTVLLSGVPQEGSGATDPNEIPFLLYRWPLQPITEAEYEAMLAAHEAGRDLDQAVDFTREPPLF